ncbi:hypothetical protein BDU57DRAFT_211095 [Ampelomyces quisqualis]|uniref:F-box domain-containing protein n=1 Tax=Ampelomyces quisqualis TaxID=50730 RepID=A0A6A5QKK0_AMPQU|nr:hypothetical protein BDU57DRAFT_211095 [Ampelomyces quisqualis]
MSNSYSSTQHFCCFFVPIQCIHSCICACNVNSATRDAASFRVSWPSLHFFIHLNTSPTTSTLLVVTKPAIVTTSGAPRASLTEEAAGPFRIPDLPSQLVELVLEKLAEQDPSMILNVRHVSRAFSHYSLVAFDNGSFRCDTKVLDAARCGSRYIFTRCAIRILDLQNSQVNRASKPRPCNATRVPAPVGAST